MEWERLPVHIGCAWRYRLHREVSADQAPPLPLKGTERGLLPIRALCASSPMYV